MSGKHTSLRPRSRQRGVGAIVLAVVGGTLVAFALHGDVSSTGTRVASKTVVATEDPRRPPPPGQLAPKPKTADSSLAPVSLRIPSIDVTANITSLGLNTDKTVEVPSNPDDAGWYSKGPKPGENGSAVILGHVDSKTGPAVFYRLKQLGTGDQVAVKLSDDTVAHYQVARVAQYANEDFPASKVYAGSPERPALNLVTCGGEYDRADGGYQSNVVVYATYLWATDGSGSPERTPER